MKLGLIFKKTLSSNFSEKEEKPKEKSYRSLKLAESWERKSKTKHFKLMYPTSLPVGKELFRLYDMIDPIFLDKIVELGRNYDSVKHLCSEWVIRDLYLMEISRNFTEKEAMEETKKINQYFRYNLIKTLGKFSQAEKGRKVWDILLQEWGTIKEVKNSEVRVAFDDGKERLYNLHGEYEEIKIPVLYYTKKVIDVSDDIPVIPFNLVNFLKRNLKPSKFKNNQDNYFLYFKTDIGRFDYSTHKEEMIAGVVYLDITNTNWDTNNAFKDIVIQLNNNLVKSKELTQAYVELGWI